MDTAKLEKRLEIRLYPKQLQKLKDEAEAKNTSVGELVREAIEQRYEVSVQDKLEALQMMSSINAPVSTWEEMKKEIERGIIKET